jgi:hypothetical protein
MPVRSVSDLIDRVPGRKISHLGKTKVLLPGLDIGHGIEGGNDSNLLLGFKQSSLTHIIQG